MNEYNAPRDGLRPSSSTMTVPRPKTELLRRWLEMAACDDVVVDPADIHHEAIANLWAFSPTPQESTEITAEDLCIFIQALVQERRTKIKTAGMLFYCWHDAQARQLRFSMVSQAHGRLPFRCSLQPTDIPMEIALRVVQDDWHNEAFGRISDDDVQDTEDSTPFVLPVFVATL